MNYYYGENEPPQIVNESNPRLSTASRELKKHEQQHLETMWTSIHGWREIDSGLIGGENMVDTSETPIIQINEMIAGSLWRTCIERSTASQIEIHSSANVVQSKLEAEEVLPHGIILSNRAIWTLQSI